jgi:methyl-accepting chemotaxis protein
MSEGTIPATGTQGAQAPQGETPRRLIRNYLIDANLQLRFASYLVAVAAAISVGLGYLLWSAYRESSRLVSLGDPRVDDALATMLAQEDRARMVWLAAGLVVIVLCLLVFAIVVTHRVAGPAVALARTCRRVAQGDLSRPRPLRRRDLLVDLADEMAMMVERLREQEESERAALAEVAATLRRSGAGGPAHDAALRLEQLAGEKAARVRP